MMDIKNDKEKPEVYALRQKDGNWQISRREFLKAAGLGAAALGMKFSRSYAQGDQPAGSSAASDPYLDACSTVSAHNDNISSLLLSPDGRYLISCSPKAIKCWDLENEYLMVGRVDGKNVLGAADTAVIGRIFGKDSILGNGSDVSNLQFLALPLNSESVKETLSKIEGKYDALAVDADGNIYGASGGSVKIWYDAVGPMRIWYAEDAYWKSDVLYQSENGEKIRAIRLLNEDSELFILFASGAYGVLDLKSLEYKGFIMYSGMAVVCPDEKQVLLYKDTIGRLSLVSLSDGKALWEKDIRQLDFIETDGTLIKGMAVAKDGKTAYVAGSGASKSGVVRMISMEDGAVLDSVELCPVMTKKMPLVLPEDGKRIIIAVNERIFVYSLPDLKLIALPEDFFGYIYQSSGMGIAKTDPETGVTYTYFTGPGTEIPEGAVCVCNTVTGAGVLCGCDSHSCSCDNNGGHYWHPN